MCGPGTADARTAVRPVRVANLDPMQLDGHAGPRWNARKHGLSTEHVTDPQEAAVEVVINAITAAPIATSVTSRGCFSAYHAVRRSIRSVRSP